MALGASRRPGRLSSLLGLLMTTFAVLMSGLLHGKSLSFRLGLVAVFAQFAGSFALLPGMVALHAIDFICVGVFLMVKGHFSIRNIESNCILLSKGAGNHH